MLIYDTKQITDCIIGFIEINSIKPALISLTLVFGSCGEEEETPELLVGILTCEEYKSLLEENDFFESILNQAEYEYQEIAYECLDGAIKIKKGLSREDYISELLKAKYTIEKEIKDRLGYKVLVYVHDLDDFDYNAIFQYNFTKEEGEAILSKSICN